MKLKKYLSTNGEGINKTNKIARVLFAIYLMVLIWILLFKLGVRFSYMGNRSVNLIPFSEFFTSNGKIDFSEIILNALIFVPLGIYAGVLFKRWNFGYKLFLFFLISSLIEGLQFILRYGAFDITDIIANILGGIIGLLIFELIGKLFNNSIRSGNFIIIMATIGTVLMVSLLILLKLNMLPIRYQ